MDLKDLDLKDWLYLTHGPEKTKELSLHQRADMANTLKNCLKWPLTEALIDRIFCNRHPDFLVPLRENLIQRYEEISDKLPRTVGLEAATPEEIEHDKLDIFICMINHLIADIEDEAGKSNAE